MYFWILLAVIAYLFYLYCIVPLQHFKKLGVPYVKPLWPIFGNHLQVMRQKTSVAEWIQDMYNSFKDKRYIGVYQFSTPLLIIKDLDLLKQIMIKDFDYFVDRRPFVSEEMEPIFGKNLISLQGERWKQMRATVSPTFTGSKMRQMFVLMKECTDQFLKYFDEKIGPNETLTVELKDIFSKFANDVIASTAFGIKCDSLKDENNEFYVVGKQATSFKTDTLLKMACYQFCPSIMKLFNIKIFSDKVSNFFRNIVTNNIKYREENGIIRPDMIHLMMEARKGKLNHEDNTRSNKDDQTGFATVEESHIGKDMKQATFDLTDDAITSQSFLFFLAGFDSISNTMCYLLYELAINADIQEKLQKEIDDTLQECNQNLTYEVLMKMKYLDMVFSETLRKWPGGPWVDRICVKPYTIQAKKPDEKPITLKKNDIILIPMFPMHRNPDYFPDPLKFDPERFNDKNKENIKPFSYLPFGSGPRNCIGSRFAILEIKLIICSLLSKLNVVLVEKSDVPIVLTRTAFAMTAQNGFWVGLKKRKL